MLLALVLALLGARAVQGDLAGALERLGAPSALERARAQAWIGLHARREDFPRLAAAARAADAEGRGRLARALATDDRHVGLAVLFALESAPELAAIGRGALEDAALRWSEELARTPLTGVELERRLARLAKRGAGAPFLLDLARPLETGVGLLRRRGGLSAGLVLDPDVGPRPPDPAALERPFGGAWDRVLLALARDNGVALEGFGLEDLDQPAPAARRWLRLAPLRGAGRETGAALLVRWCLRVAEPGDLERRRAAARALAACGWPAAVAWLEELWRERADEAALEGLVLAASVGRVAPALASEQGLRALRERAARALAEAVPGPAGADAVERASELVHAAGALGCLDARGAPLAPVLLEGWDACGARERWWRLAVLELAGCASGAEARCEALLRELLDAPGTPAAVRFQALAAWCALEPALVPLDAGGAPPALAGRDALVAAARRPDRAAELLAFLERAGVAADEAWRAPDAEGAALAAAWQLAGEALEPAARSLVQAVAGGAGERARELLDGLVGRGQGPRAAAALARAAALAGDARGPLDEIAFRLGLLQGEALQAFLDARGPVVALPDGLLGAWAVRGPDPAQAQELLLARLQEALGGGEGEALHAALARSVEEALAGLFAAGRDAEAVRLAALARRLLDSYERSPLARELLQRGFPAPPRAAPWPLAWRERRPDPAALGR